jgi:hypothetical protein
VYCWEKAGEGASTLCCVATDIERLPEGASVTTWTELRVWEIRDEPRERRRFNCWRIEEQFVFETGNGEREKTAYMK